MILELRNICKTYVQGKLDVPVLRNVSLSVEEGDYLAIMGPSGSGKTTLMNLIGCLDTPTSGEYFLEGQDLSGETDLKLSQVRLRSIGFVFQSFYLLSRQSAVENVALPLLYAGVRRKERLELARKALERVGLGDRTEFKPTQLSGGQCQRVAIARAIVNNPKILLADEPTGALDTKAGEQIMEIFQRLNQEGVTIVMITHEPQIAAHAQRTLHIRDGRLTDANGNFLSPAEPESVEEQESPQQQPAKEQLSLPLSSRDISPEKPAAVLDDLFAAMEEQSPSQEEPSPESVETESLPAPLDSNIVAETFESTPEAQIVSVEAPVEPAVPEEISSTPDPQEKPDVSETSTGEQGKQHEELPDDHSIAEFDDSDTDTFLDTEISALLDAEVSFATGDDFLKKAGIPSSEQETAQTSEAAAQLEEAQETETPALVARSTKTGAPDQISFDIWAEPEPSAEAEENASEPEPAEQLDFTDLSHTPAEEVTETVSLEEQEEAKTKAELPFDTAFDAVESYTPQEQEASLGQFGVPLKTEVDLSNPWGQQDSEPAAPESGAPEQTSPTEQAAPKEKATPRKLIEIEDIRVDFGDDEG